LGHIEGMILFVGFSGSCDVKPIWIPKLKMYKTYKVNLIVYDTDNRQIKCYMLLCSPNKVIPICLWISIQAVNSCARHQHTTILNTMAKWSSHVGYVWELRFQPPLQWLWLWFYRLWRMVVGVTKWYVALVIMCFISKHLLLRFRSHVGYVWKLQFQLNIPLQDIVIW
jgi:hypothetical protein